MKCVCAVVSAVSFGLASSKAFHSPEVGAMVFCGFVAFCIFLDFTFGDPTK
jgi:hypothetical protein